MHRSPPRRGDLGDLGIRIRNLQERHDHAVRRFRVKARTLPGLAYSRLAIFGTDLNPDPVIIETGRRYGPRARQSIREWGSPTAVVRKLVNGQHLDDYERTYAVEIEQHLKGEADRLHQELARRVPSNHNTLRKLTHSPWAVGIGSAVAATLISAGILYLLGGIDSGDSSGVTTITVETPPQPDG